MDIQDERIWDELELIALDLTKDDAIEMFKCETEETEEEIIFWVKYLVRTHTHSFLHRSYYNLLSVDEQLDYKHHKLFATLRNRVGQLNQGE